MRYHINTSSHPQFPYSRFIVPFGYKKRPINAIADVLDIRACGVLIAFCRQSEFRVRRISRDVANSADGANRRRRNRPMLPSSRH